MTSIHHVEVFQGQDKQWYYKTVAANNQVLSTSEGYTRHEDALRAAREAYGGMEISTREEE